MDGRRVVVTRIRTSTNLSVRPVDADWFKMMRIDWFNAAITYFPILYIGMPAAQREIYCKLGAHVSATRHKLWLIQGA